MNMASRQQPGMVSSRLRYRPTPLPRPRCRQRHRQAGRPARASSVWACTPRSVRCRACCCDSPPSGMLSRNPFIERCRICAVHSGFHGVFGLDGSRRIERNPPLAHRHEVVLIAELGRSGLHFGRYHAGRRSGRKDDLGRHQPRHGGGESQSRKVRRRTRGSSWNDHHTHIAHFPLARRFPAKQRGVIARRIGQRVPAQQDRPAGLPDRSQARARP